MPRLHARPAAPRLPRRPRRAGGGPLGADDRRDAVGRLLHGHRRRRRRRDLLGPRGRRGPELRRVRRPRHARVLHPRALPQARGRQRSSSTCSSSSTRARRGGDRRPRGRRARPPRDHVAGRGVGPPAATGDDPALERARAGACRGATPAAWSGRSGEPPAAHERGDADAGEHQHDRASRGRQSRHRPTNGNEVIARATSGGRGAGQRRLPGRGAAARAVLGGRDGERASQARQGRALPPPRPPSSGSDADGVEPTCASPSACPSGEGHRVRRRYGARRVATTPSATRRACRATCPALPAQRTQSWSIRLPYVGLYW